MKVSNQILNIFFESIDLKKIINEVTSGAGNTSANSDVDDGPIRMYKTKKEYTTTVQHLTQLVGYKILNHVVNDIDFKTLEDYPEYNYSVVKGSSFFQYDTNDDLWKGYIAKVAEVVGYKFLKFNKQSKNM